MSAEQESILTVQLASRLKACSSIIGVIFDDELEQTLSELTDEEMGFTASAPGMLADTGERLSAIQERIKLLRESAKKVRRALTYARDAQILDEPPRTMSDTVSSAAKPDLPPHQVLHQTDRSTKGKRISDSYEADRSRIFSKVQDAGPSIAESGSDNMKVIIKSADIGKFSFRDTTKEGSVRTERTEDISGKDKFKDDYQQEEDHQKEGQIKESESKHSIFSSTDSDECSHLDDYFATLKDHVHTAEDPSSHSPKKLKPSFLNSTTEWLMKVLRRSSSGNDVADDPEAAKARKTIAIHLLKALERLGQLKNSKASTIYVQIARNRRSEPTILKFTLPL